MIDIVSNATYEDARQDCSDGCGGSGRFILFFFLSLDVCVCVILDFFLRFYDFAKRLSEFRMYEYSQCVCVCVV